MRSIRWLLAVLAMFGVAWASTPNAIASENVLLIIADDYGVSSHGLYGYASSSPPTPNLDAMAAQGAVFDNAWANPKCSPTRATILTGRYCFRTGMGSPGHNFNPNEYTVANALKTLGYNTGCFGKWHLRTQDNPLNFPNLMGFDHFSGFTGRNISNYFEWPKVTNGAESIVTNYSTTEITDDAIAWISLQDSQPWFCLLAYAAPHSPYHKPPNDLHSYDSLSGTDADITLNTVSYYEAMVEAMDTEIGRLFGAIDPGVLAKTNVIFIGDNGTPSPVAVPPGQPLRVKGTLYQGGVWVPWLMKGPSIPQIATRVTGLVHTVDLFSTIIDLAGGTTEALVPAGIIVDSKSVMPLLSNPGSTSIHDYIMTEGFHENPLVLDGKTIRNEEYKFIRFDNFSEQFYHIADDTWELVDLLAGTLTPTQQDNYDSLNALLDNLLLTEFPLPSATINFISGSTWMEVNQILSMEVTVTNSIGPMEYAWLKNGLEIPGAISSICTIESLTSEDSGTYRAKVTTEDVEKGIIYSDPIIISVFEEGSIPLVGTSGLFGLMICIVLSSLIIFRRRLLNYTST